MSAKLCLKTKAAVEEVENILEAVEQLGCQEGWSPTLLFRVKLVIEELGINVVNHASVDKIPEIEIAVTSEPDMLTIHIADDGQPFDPLSDAPPPDLTSPLEGRLPGGLGIHLVRSIMDEMTYRREQGKNHLALTKRRVE